MQIFWFLVYVVLKKNFKLIFQNEYLLKKRIIYEKYISNFFNKLNSLNK